MSHAVVVEPANFGLMAEFDNADALLAAAGAARRAGYTKMDAHSPFPIHGMEEALGIKERLVAPIVLAGGITGLVGGWGLEYWTQVIAMPLNIGGRPYNSWVSFIPPAFETTILFAAFAAVFGMLALNGLPRPYHPVFNVARFERASQDRFFLVIETLDPKFDAAGTRQFLQSQHALEVVDVAN